MKTKYIIVKGESQKYFEERVNEKLNEGWLFHGDSSFVVIGYNLWYIQAFFRVVK